MRPACRLRDNRHTQAGIFERVYDFQAHFVVIGAYARANGCDQVSSIRAMSATHRRYRSRHHARDNASPSGVDSGYDFAVATGDQYRNTVCRPNGQHDTPVSRDHGIRRRVFVSVTRIDVQYAPAVNLINRSSPAAITSDRRQEQLVVALDLALIIGRHLHLCVRWLIEVQCVKRCRTDAAEACRKCMRHMGLRKQRRLVGHDSVWMVDALKHGPNLVMFSSASNPGRPSGREGLAEGCG